MSERWATFDCYGTLIDWNGGLWTEFATVWPDADHDRLLELYHVIEPHIEEHGDLTYDEVLVRRAGGGRRHRGAVGPDGPRARARRVAAVVAPVRRGPGRARRPSRPRVEARRALEHRPEPPAPSVESIGVPFDISITEAETGSYKPAHAHWERFFADTGAERAQHVHVAASLFHDIAPAARSGSTPCGSTGSRRTATSLAPPSFPDLTRLPDTLDELRLGPAVGELRDVALEVGRDRPLHPALGVGVRHPVTPSSIFWSSSGSPAISQLTARRSKRNSFRRCQMSSAEAPARFGPLRIEAIVPALGSQ